MGLKIIRNYAHSLIQFAWESHGGEPLRQIHGKNVEWLDDNGFCYIGCEATTSMPYPPVFRAKTNAGKLTFRLYTDGSIEATLEINDRSTFSKDSKVLRLLKAYEQKTYSEVEKLEERLTAAITPIQTAFEKRIEKVTAAAGKRFKKEIYRHLPSAVEILLEDEVRSNSDRTRGSLIQKIEETDEDEEDDDDTVDIVPEIYIKVHGEYSTKEAYRLIADVFKSKKRSIR